jgi:asparagine synthase (glutamine-hydrolysing)
MCGIWSYIDLINNKIEYNKVLTLFNNFYELNHRGPNLSDFKLINNVAIGFHRLAILDISFNSNQPFFLKKNNNTIIFLCNGEIYNYSDLIKKYNLDINNNSDCLTIPKLYLLSNSIEEFKSLFINEIKGEFAFILFEYDEKLELKQMIIGRDQIGVRPLYSNNIDLTSKSILLSSEIKGMKFYNENVKEFEPGTILNINFNNNIIDNIKSYNFKTVYNIIEINENDEYYLEKIRNAVINSVKRRLISDKPISFLLSGGVDSSIIAAVSSKLLDNTNINTFCCGMNNGTDLKYAKMVSNFIKSNHTEVIFTSEEALNTIEDVIYTTETWDTTTIRASVGQYLVSKYISTKTDFKVVLVGEGPDEVCSSYLFNYYAPNGKELHNIAKEYVKNIHMYDGKRADRCISKWSLEARIPFLDPEFINIYWSLPSEWRHPKYKGIEKWYLRKAFEGYLPDEVLWRKKEAFSDAISSKDNSWFNIIQTHIKSLVDLESNLGPTLEASYYKKIFINFYENKRINIIPNYWQPPLKWLNKEKDLYIDPSARILDIYNN